MKRNRSRCTLRTQFEIAYLIVDNEIRYEWNPPEGMFFKPLYVHVPDDATLDEIRDYLDERLLSIN